MKKISGIVSLGLTAMLVAPTMAVAKATVVTWAVADLNGQKPYVEAFNSSQDEVVVKMVKVPEEQDFMTQAISGESADVMQYTWSSFGTWVNDKLVEPLDPYLVGSVAKNYRYMGNIKNLRYAGKLYTLPVYTHTMLIYYNLDLIKRSGLPNPANSWTWDDFRAYAKRLTGYLGKASFWTWPNWYQDYGYQKGALEIEGNFKPFAEGWKYLSDMRNIDKSLNKDDGFYKGFETGNLALYQCAPYMIKNLRLQDTTKDKLNWEIAPMPVPKGVPANTVQANWAGGLSIIRTSKAKAAAWKFLEWMAGPQAAAIRVKNGDLPAITFSGIERMFSNDNGQRPNNVNFLFDANYQVIKFHPAASEMNPIIDKWARQVIEGAVTADQGRKSVEKSIQPILKKYKLI